MKTNKIDYQAWANQYVTWSQAKIKAFRQDLLAWYDQHQRDLPWRHTRDPYLIWVSEIMLQQTQVNTVIPYYERFTQALPSVADLATCPEDQLLKLWQGLGYYSRVKHMQTAAQTMMAESGGVMPSSYQALIKLKGIGPYTGAAIASIAYQEPVPAVDGNLFRIGARLFEIAEDIALPQTRYLFEAIFAKLIDPDRPGDFNQALMDIGAMVMMPHQTVEQHNPLLPYDQSFHKGTSLAYPVKSKRVKVKHEAFIALVIRQNQHVLMHQHESDQLLSDLWHYPLFPCDKSLNQLKLVEIHELIRDYLKEITPAELHFEFAVNAVLDEVRLQFPQVKHIFTHRIWQIQVVEINLTEPNRQALAIKETYQWVTAQAYEALAKSTLQQKLAHAVERR